MESWKSGTSIMSDLWIGAYSIIRVGDLVYVGPVHNKRLGIALDRKTVEFGFEPDEWNILVNGQIEVHSLPYISPYSDEELLANNYHYNYHSY